MPKVGDVVGLKNVVVAAKGGNLFDGVGVGVDEAYLPVELFWYFEVIWFIVEEGYFGAGEG